MSTTDGCRGFIVFVIIPISVVIAFFREVVFDFDVHSGPKSKVYPIKPQTISDLKGGIERVVNDMPSVVCERVIENFNDRIHQPRAFLGGHKSGIVFHA